MVSSRCRFGWHSINERLHAAVRSSLDLEKFGSYAGLPEGVNALYG